MAMSHLYKVIKVIKVVDGDTVDAEVDTGFYHKCTQRFRLFGIDTPERGEEGYKEATERLKELLDTDELYVHSKKTGSFGRWLGTFYTYDEKIRGEEGTGMVNINKAMEDEGFAKKYQK